MIRRQVQIYVPTNFQTLAVTTTETFNVTRGVHTLCPSFLVLGTRASKEVQELHFAKYEVSKLSNKQLKPLAHVAKE